MEKSCLVLGQTNVGKTLFVINFADFLGKEKLKVAITAPDGAISNVAYHYSDAKERLVNSQEHSTTGLQLINIEVPHRKGNKGLKLIDSTGLIDGIHPDTMVRRGMAMTLRALSSAAVILHMIDPSQEVSLSQVDKELMRLGHLRTGYAVLVNKIDLVEVRLKLSEVKEKLQGLTILPVSALTREGFSDVKRFIGKNI